MDEYGANKKYEPFKIPVRTQEPGNGIVPQLAKTEKQPVSSLSDDVFYEIEYSSGPVPGVGKFVLRTKSQIIDKPEKDEVRELFGRMRDIARAFRSEYGYSRFFDRRVQNNNAAIFYKQGLFMKDFVDDYAGHKDFSQYFPYYQMMGYEQLRTYFTWRTQVRKGCVADISLSYAFLYVYELLGNIGTTEPLDGLNKLMSFWKAFGKHNKTIDQYVLRWLKDYHVYYVLPHTFNEFVAKYDLAGFYPKLAAPDGDFDLFLGISKYNIKKSIFFTNETSKMISDCFFFVIDRIRQEFNAAGMNFDNALFTPARKITEWKPFKDALFYQWVNQPDRQIVFSENEIYRCKNNEWTFSTVIATEKGRQFIGYVMKKTESVLRNITKYRYKLTANTNMINDDTVRILAKAGLNIENIVQASVLEYYREATKTVVTLDNAALARIRRDALVTQESLIVEEQTQPKVIAPIPVLAEPEQSIFADTAVEESLATAGVWDDFKNALDELEINAIGVLLQNGDIKAFADQCGIMVEVLIDGINEKAMDFIGDSLMDEEFVIYDDYKGHAEELIK